MVNGLIGTHIATNTPVEIPLNASEMQLFHAGGNHQWFQLCESVKSTHWYRDYRPDTVRFSSH